MMMQHRLKGGILALAVLVLIPTETTADSPSDILPNSWSGLISLEWKSGIPNDSPLHQQIDRVTMEFSKKWQMRVDLQKISRGPARVRYGCASASVDYLETSKTDATNGAVRSFEEWKIEAKDRTLDDRQCNLILVVDAGEKRYWVEVGGFQIPDAQKTGTIVMSVSGGGGATEPIDKETDVIEPIRFEGEFSDPRPKVLNGLFDAHVEPPRGLDITYETLGGTIEWQLYAGWRFLEDPFGYPSACPEFTPEFEECRTDDLCFCLFVSTVTGADLPAGGSRLVTVDDCLELYCPWAPGTPEFEKALDVIEDRMGGAR